MTSSICPCPDLSLSVCSVYVFLEADISNIASEFSVAAAPTVGTVIRQHMQAKGLRTVDIARALNMRYEHLCRVINDKAKCSLETSLRLSALLGIEDDVIPILMVREQIAELRRRNCDAPCP